jgi:hypothetical protein
VTVTDFRDEMSGGEFRKVNVTYIEQAYCCDRPYLGRRMINPHELSEWGRLALEQAAHEIAIETAKIHAQYTIDATLNQGIFKP